MKLNSQFIAHRDRDGMILVSTGDAAFSGLVRSNQTAGFILECLEQETTLDEIVSKMQAAYDGPADLMRRDAERIIETLRSIGALDGDD